MQTTSFDLAPQSAVVSRIAAGVRDDQLTGPTPCTDLPVAAVLRTMAETPPRRNNSGENP